MSLIRLVVSHLNWTGKGRNLEMNFFLFSWMFGFNSAYHNLTAHHRSPSPPPHPSLYTLNSLIHLFIIHLLTSLNFSSFWSSSSTNTTTHCTNPLWNTHSYLLTPTYLSELFLKLMNSDLTLIDSNWLQTVASSVGYVLRFLQLIHHHHHFIS